MTAVADFAPLLGSVGGGFVLGALPDTQLSMRNPGLSLVYHQCQTTKER